MRISSKIDTMLMPGLTALFSLAYYIPKSKKVKRLLKKYPKTTEKLWVDAFNAGLTHGMMCQLREDDDEV